MPFLKYPFVLLFVLLTFGAFAQSETIPPAPPPPPPPVIFSSRPESMPRFWVETCEKLESEKDKKKCSEEALLELLYSNLQYTKTADSFEGTVIIQFIIQKDGTPSKFKVVRSISPLLDKEALRVVQLLKKWVPGSLYQKPVDITYNMPVKFKW